MITNKNKYITIYKEIIKKYPKNLSITFNDLEKVRKKYKNAILYTILIIPVLIITIYYIGEIIKIHNFYHQSDYYTTIGMLCFVIPLHIILSIIYNIIPKRKNYKIAFNYYFTKKVYEKYFYNPTFKIDSVIDSQILISSKIINLTDSVYKGREYVYAQYKDTTLTESLITTYKEIEYMYNNKVHLKKFKRFSGKWIQFEIPKNFIAHFQIYPHNYKYYPQKTIYLKEKFYKYNPHSEEFNKIFTFGTTNINEVKPSITNSTINKIIKLNSSIENSIILSLFDNKIHIGIYGKNNKKTKEKKIFKKLNEGKILQIYENETKAILTFIDEILQEYTLYK